MVVVVVGLGASLGGRVDADLCNPFDEDVAAGLPVFARGGGGRIEDALLVFTLPVELSGRVEDVVDVDVDRVGGLTGSLLGDWAFLGAAVGFSRSPAAGSLPYLLVSDGLRRESFRGGIVDIVLLWVGDAGGLFTHRCITKLYRLMYGKSSLMGNYQNTTEALRGSRLHGLKNGLKG